MAFEKTIVIFTLFVLSGCASHSTLSSNPYGDETVITPKAQMRHNLRELVRYDKYGMARIVDREVNSRELDEQKYLTQASRTLAQTVMTQPNYEERSAALRELRGKIEEEDYIQIIPWAADQLLYFSRSESISDQATALVGLANIIQEIKNLGKPELKPVLEKIAAANVQISKGARQYAQEPMARIKSPSDEARIALGLPES